MISLSPGNKTHPSICIFASTLIIPPDEELDDYADIPPEEQIKKLRKIIQQVRDERWDAVTKKDNYRYKAGTSLKYTTYRCLGKFLFIELVGLVKKKIIH